jgi:cytochrome c
MNAICNRIVLVVITLALMTIPVRVVAFDDRSSASLELVEKAEGFIKEKGKDYALKVFCASKGPFIDKELYVFACSMDNRLLAHPYSPDLVGRDVSDFKDTKGKLVFQEFRKVADERGSGWVTYWWTKPVEPGGFSKTTYVRRIPEYNMYVGVGFYKPVQSSQDKNEPSAD